MDTVAKYSANLEFGNRGYKKDMTSELDKNRIVIGDDMIKASVFLNDNYGSTTSVYKPVTGTYSTNERWAALESRLTVVKHYYGPITFARGTQTMASNELIRNLKIMQLRKISPILAFDESSSRTTFLLSRLLAYAAASKWKVVGLHECLGLNIPAGPVKPAVEHSFCKKPKTIALTFAGGPTVDIAAITKAAKDQGAKVSFLVDKPKTNNENIQSLRDAQNEGMEIVNNGVGFEGDVENGTRMFGALLTKEGLKVTHASGPFINKFTAARAGYSTLIRGEDTNKWQAAQYVYRYPSLFPAEIKRIYEPKPDVSPIIRMTESYISAQVVTETVKNMKALGYTFVTISECLSG